ncbi:MAG: penicillin-binding protein 2 [Ardenticatenaceae bacterium]|nr:penicillin-binding protein 2 [Ardenticatenaceae bacterium]MCB9442834.1 penicillin-binding protein 2 [Ardenticatenaceae bacterium]
MSSNQGLSLSQLKRLWVIITIMVVAMVVVTGRLVAFQLLQVVPWDGWAGEEELVVDVPERGVIYDRNGAILASNGVDYQVSAAPNNVTEPEELATALSSILEEPRYDILSTLQQNREYVLLAGRVSPEVAKTIETLPYSGVELDPLPRRFYPQGQMLCHTLGYVDFNGDGGGGIEGNYQQELAGQAASATLNRSPLSAQHSVIAREGADLVLTIDRSVQNLVETHLRRAMEEHGAVSGEIIVMDPRTGAILAMAASPCFDPYTFYDEKDESVFLNPFVTRQYEPGSVMKLITMSAALDSGTVTPQTTYYDAGVLEWGGHLTYNWDRSAPGTTDMTTLLSRSLNVGAATIATWMGPDTFYSYFQRFGFGRPTGIDLMAESSGLMPLPGDPLWTESFLATNAYGQGLAVTPLQMITAVSALANGGEMMQPYLVQEIDNGGEVFEHTPTVLSRPISEETAQQVTAMAVTAVAREVPEAQVEGYTIAGKTGTAQIAENGVYLSDDIIGSFIGWLPADDPEIIVMVKLDKPKSAPWGSMTAAPVFADLTSELVVLLGIPPDNVRLRADVMAARQEN